MRVREVEGERALTRLRAAAERGHQQRFKCDQHSPLLPTLDELQGSPGYVVLAIGTALMALAGPGGRIAWLCFAAPVEECFDEASGPCAVRTLVDEIVRRHGGCFGHVENPELRARFAALGYEIDGTLVRHA